MNKYVIAMVALGIAGFYGMKELKETYRRFSSNSVDLPQKIPEVRKSAANNKKKDSEIIYYVTVDRFADGDSGNNLNVNLSDPLDFHGGDLAGLLEKLDYIKSLGVDAILLTPLALQSAEKSAIKLSNGEKFNFSQFIGTSPVDPSKMDPRFGNFQQLLDLVIEAHQKGLKVYLSFDLNGVAEDSPLLDSPRMEEFFLTSEEGEDCDLSLRRKTVGSCLLYGNPDFTQNKPATQNYLYSVLKQNWTRLGIDGIYLENVFAYDQEFLAKLVGNLKKDYGSDFKVISAYRLTRADNTAEFFDTGRTDLRFDETLRSNLLSFLQKETDKEALHTHLEKMLSELFPSQDTLTFLNDRWYPSMYYRLFENADLTKLAFTFHAALGTNILMEYGEEVAKVDGAIPFILSDYPWNDQKTSPGMYGSPQPDVLKHYKKIIGIRNEHPQAFNGFYKRLSLPGTENLFCFSKNTIIKDKEEKDAFSKYNSWSCFNTSDERRAFKVTVDERLQEWAGKRGGLKDLVSGKRFPITAGEITVDVPAVGAVILTPF